MLALFSSVVFGSGRFGVRALQQPFTLALLVCVTHTLAAMQITTGPAAHDFAFDQNRQVGMEDYGRPSVLRRDLDEVLRIPLNIYHHQDFESLIANGMEQKIDGLQFRERNYDDFAMLARAGSSRRISTDVAVHKQRARYVRRPGVCPSPRVTEPSSPHALVRIPDKSARRKVYPYQN